MDSIQPFIKKFLRIYPLPIRNALKDSVFISKEKRSRKGEKIDASYDAETGEIILWNPSKLKEEDLFIVLTHEWGHKLYHEWLTDNEKREWLRIRSEECIDFDLSKFYLSVQLPEEEFCSVFCIVSQKLYFMRQGMQVASKKIGSKMEKQFPRSAAFVQKRILKSSVKRRTAKAHGEHNITHREVEVVKAWIREALQS